MDEIYNNLPGYEELYKVSNWGNIISKTLKWNKMAQSTSKRGYLYLTTHKDGIRKRKFAHQLVAITFIPNPEGKPCVNHKDGNKLNNHVDNLEWCTIAENIRHACENGLRKNMQGEKSNFAKLSEADVLKIRELYKTEYARSIAKKYNVTPYTIGNIVNRKSWKHI